MKLLKNNKGFTLLEMLVVLLIIGILVGILLFFMLGNVKHAKAVADRATGTELGKGAIAYEIENGSLPTKDIVTVTNPDVIAILKEVLKSKGVKEKIFDDLNNGGYFKRINPSLIAPYVKSRDISEYVIIDKALGIPDYDNELAGIVFSDNVYTDKNGTISSGELVLLPGGTVGEGIVTAKQIKQVIIKDGFGMVVLNNGDVMVWGDNYHSLLGLDENSFGEIIYTPIKHPHLSNVEKILYNGGSEFLVFTTNGDLLHIEYDEPQPVPESLNQIVSIKDQIVAYQGVYVLLEDGTMFDVRFTDQTIAPVHVHELSNIKKIVVGQTQHYFALSGDGTLYAWGANQYGNLGIGTTDYINIATPTPILTNVKDVVSLFHSLALLNDGSVYAWGYGYAGQLGLGPAHVNDYNGHPTPTQIHGLTNVKKIAVGDYYSFAILENGTVMGWGRNAEGQLGNGESGWSANKDSPVAINNLYGIIELYAGYYSAGLRDDGTLVVFGENDDGMLGLDLGEEVDYVSVPTPLPFK